MLISYNWLKQYVNLSGVEPEDLAKKLTLSTVEVEGVTKEGRGLQNIVVGKVLKTSKHPNADKLLLCEVDDGEKKLPVVCGGSNVKEGMLVAFAKVGAKVRWHGEGELIELVPAVIRGEKSEGMICSASEIGLGEMFPQKSEKEIVDLSAIKTKVGTPLAEALGLDDAILEIDNKSMSNRPDLWGHYGLAREVAALFNKNLTGYNPAEIKPGKEIKHKVKVEDTKKCPRYMAVAVEGVDVGPSPDWMKTRLVAAGLRPINNIVDITNFIMLDIGQPMHAFSADALSQKVKGKSLPAGKAGQKSIFVRCATSGEKITTLDGKEINLDENTLLIADEDRPLAIAGVIGGEESAVGESTKTVIFEAANFEASAIRRSSLKYGLRTDSSARFEKSLDPHMAETALRRAVELVLECCPKAKVASQVVDEKNFFLSRAPIEFTWDFLKAIIGTEIDKKETTAILKRLGFEVKTDKTQVFVTVPTWRAVKDITLPEDVAEEIIRFLGYEKIPVSLPLFPINPPEANVLLNLKRRLANILRLESGATESLNYSFVSGDVVEKFGDNLAEYLELYNPLSKEKPYLRRSLLPGLLENIRKNIENFDEVCLFEIGKVFKKERAGQRENKGSDVLLPGQETCLTFVFSSKKDKAPFWSARRASEFAMKEIKADFSVQIPATPKPWHYAPRVGEILIKDKKVGEVYEVSSVRLQKMGIETRVGVLELNLDALIETSFSEVTRYESLPEYPVVSRDIAFTVKKETTHKDLSDAISSVDPLIHGVSLFDVYEGKGMEENEKSVAYRLTLSDPKRTLLAEEAEAVMKKATKMLADKFGAKVRS